MAPTADAAEIMEPDQLVKLPIAVHGRQELTLGVFGPSVSLSQSLYMAVTGLEKLRNSRGPAKLIIVGVAGPTGAGKTTLAKKLSSMIPGSQVISMRDYFRPRRGGSRGGSKRLYCDRASDPSSFDIALLEEHLRSLQGGDSVQAPCFDFLTRRRSCITVHPPSGGVLVVEGVCALEDRLHQLYDLSIFIVGGLYFDLLRRIASDIGRQKFVASDVFPVCKSCCSLSLCWLVHAKLW